MRALHLADDVVRALPFADENHRRYFSDLTSKSLKIIVSSNRKVFLFAPSGGRGWRIGFFPSMTTEQARATAGRLERTLFGGSEFISILKESREVGPSNIPTFAALIEAYLEWLPTRKRYTRGLQDQKLLRRNLLDPTINSSLEKPATEVTETDVALLIRKIIDRPAPTVALRCFARLRSIFKWAMQPDARRRFQLRSNPVENLSSKDLDLKRTPRYSGRTLETPEIKAYMAAADRLTTPHDTALAMSILLTGVPVYKLALMRWSQLDFEQKLWRLSEVTALRLSDAMVTLLQNLRTRTRLDDQDFVFGPRRSVSKGRSHLRSELTELMKCASRDNAAQQESWRWKDILNSVRVLLRCCGTNEYNINIALGKSRQLSDRGRVFRSVDIGLNRLATKLEAVRTGDLTDVYEDLNWIGTFWVPIQ